MLSNIGKKIKEAREEQGISQRDLGMSLGLTDKAISAYEACRTIPPLETLVRIAQELHKPLDYFIHNETNAFRIETQLSRMETVVTKYLEEIVAIRKALTERPPASDEAINTSNSSPSQLSTADETENLPDDALGNPFDQQDLPQSP